MPETVLTITDDILNDYLFDTLSIDERIQVEHKMAADPALAARVAGYRAKILALKHLADQALDEEIPARLAALLPPLLGDQAPVIQPGKMADWLADGRHNGMANGHDTASQHGVVAEQQTHEGPSAYKASQGNGRSRR